MLAGVMGTEAGGTGLAGALKLLKDIDAPKMSSALATQLEGSFSSVISIDASALNGKSIEELNNSIKSIPSDPTQLMGPLTKNLDIIKRLSSEDLSKNLLQGMDGLQSLQSLIPADTRTLLTDAADGISQIKSELISGSFSELKQWSESVQGLQAELSPIFAGGAGTVEDRLVSYINTKISELIQLIFPQRQSFADKISAQFDQAISADRLAKIKTIKSELIIHMNNAKIEFDNGNFTNTAHLALASESFGKLTAELNDIHLKLQGALSLDISNSAGLASALQKRFDDLDAIEIVDFSNIKEKFVEAIKRIQAAIEKVDLKAVQGKVEEIFTKINDNIEKFDLGKLEEKLTGLQGQIQSVLDSLDGALLEVTAAIRNSFTQIKENLRSVASALGSYDDKGLFHFNVQQDIENFLMGIKKNLNESIKPMIEEFKTKIEGTLQKVQDILNSVKGKIVPAKLELQTILQGVSETLNKRNVPGKMEETRGKLDGMFNQLGPIDFNPIIDPVISQLEEMSEQLKKIDVSSMNDILLGSLKVSVEVVKHIDFGSQITDVILKEFDNILQVPMSTLKDIEEKLGSVLKKFNELEPDVILKPLDNLFDPIIKILDELKLDKLAEPLDAWFNHAAQELDKVSPAALLKPLVEVYDEIKRSFDLISPEALIKPIEDFVGDLKSVLEKLDIKGIAESISSAIESAKKSIDEISPERLFTPLVNAFERIEKALDSFSPGKLLEPLISIFDKLTAPLDNLKPEHLKLIGKAFEPLKNVLMSMDPKLSFQKVQEKFTQIQSLIQQLNIGAIIADLKVPFDSLKASFEAKGSPSSTIASTLEVINPLRNEAIGRVTNGLQQIQTQIQNAFSQSEPPAELVSRYEKVKPKLESLVPVWVKDDMTLASIKEAFQRSNPLNIRDEINHLYESVKQQFRSFSPQTLKENVKKAFDKIKDTVLALNAETLLSGVKNVIDNLHKKLDGFSLQVIVDELKGLADEIEGLIAGLDPHLIIQQLEGLISEVKAAITSFKPSEILKDLNEPYETVKEIVKEFDTKTFKETLKETFDSIKKALLKIDIGAVLKPLQDKLAELRMALEEGLKRTEAAFNEMIAAIPI